MAFALAFVCAVGGCAPDAGPHDAGPHDAGPRDAGSRDTGSADAGSARDDASTLDADAARDDAGSVDSGGSADAAVRWPHDDPPYVDLTPFGLEEPCEAGLGSLHALRFPSSDPASDHSRFVETPDALRDELRALGLPLFQEASGPSGPHRQTAGGLRPAFWLGGADAYAFQAPQVTDIVSRLGADVVILRSQVVEPRIGGALFEHRTRLHLDPSDALSFSFTREPIYRAFRAALDASQILLSYNFGHLAIDQSFRGSPLFGSRVDTQLADWCIPGTAVAGCGAAPYALEDRQVLQDPSAPAGTPLYLAAPGTSFGTLALLDFTDSSVGPTLIAREMAQRPGMAVEGFAHDLIKYDPYFNFSVVPHRVAIEAASPGFRCDYMRGLASRIREGSAEHFTFFNLLEPLDGSMDLLNERRTAAGLASVTASDFRAAEERLLQRAHGGLIEYFGGYATSADDLVADGSTCDARTLFCRVHFSSLLEQIAIWRRNPDKYFMVYGRGPKAYVDYDDEYAWQSYLHAVYLLGAGANTAYNFGSTFQFPNYNGQGRVDALSVFDNQLLDLGAPVSRYYRHEGVYWRLFEHAMVVLNPHDAAGPRSLSAALLTLLTERGLPADAVTLAPGEARILSHHRRLDDVGLRLDFTTAGLRDFLATDVISMQAEASSLRVFASDPTFMNDVLLNPVRYPHHQATLRMRVRMNFETRTEPELQHEIRALAEVDDVRASGAPIRRHVVFALTPGAPRPGPATCTGTRTCRIACPLFRSRWDIYTPFDPDSGDSRETALEIRVPNAFTPDGAFRRLDFDPQAELDVAHGHLRFRRWHMLRFAGDFNVYEVDVGADRSRDVPIRPQFVTAP